MSLPDEPCAAEGRGEQPAAATKTVADPMEALFKRLAQFTPSDSERGDRERSRLAWSRRRHCCRRRPRLLFLVTPAAKGTCSAAASELRCATLAPPAAGVKQAMEFMPRPTDVIINTPPKTGTTWTQQLVHSLRSRGDMSFDVRCPRCRADSAGSTDEAAGAGLPLGLGGRQIPQPSSVSIPAGHLPPSPGPCRKST